MDREHVALARREFSRDVESLLGEVADVGIELQPGRVDLVDDGQCGRDRGDIDAVHILDAEGDSLTGCVPGPLPEAGGLPDTMVAATSWPGMRGNVTIGFFPRKEFRSLPHRPTMRTCSRSPAADAGSSTFSITASPGFLITKAFTKHAPYRSSKDCNGMPRQSDN